MTEPNKDRRRKYDENFKREAVRHWLQSGKSAEEVGQELGLEASRLYDWKQAFGPPTPAATADLQGQVEALRRELARVTEQRDILKKTLGIISEPPPNATKGSTP
jgi:transposase-like protein